MCYVYRLFNDKRELLWVGVATNLSSRLSNHRTQRPWGNEIVTATVIWFEDKPSALIAETEAIINEKPKYNKIAGDPQALFNPIYGSCPRCGGPKQNHTVPFCPACRTKYDNERKKAKGWVPKPPPTTTCPKCGGTKDPGPSYCKACKSRFNYEYRKSKRLAKQEVNGKVTCTR